MKPYTAEMCACGKARHATRAKAELVAGRMTRQHKSRNDGEKGPRHLHAYYCQQGQCWHVGHSCVHRTKLA